MEDEDWYSDYQSLLEFSCAEEPYSAEQLLKWFEDDYQSIFKKPYPNREQLLRWCVFLTERHKIAWPYSYINELKSAFEEWNSNSDQFLSDRLLTIINIMVNYRGI